MNPVLKRQIIQTIRDPRNKAIEGNIVGHNAFHYSRDTLLVNKKSEPLMRLDEIGNIDLVRYMLTIGGRTVFDVTTEPGDRTGIEDEWEIVLELRQAVDHQKAQDIQIPLTRQEKSIINFLKQKQR